jgi:hypothetical protein
VVDDFIGKMLARQLPVISRLDHDDPVALLEALATNYVRLSAEMPEVSKLLVKDCSEAGPRLEHLLSRIRPVHDLITPVFEQAHALGHLQAHDPDSFFVFLVMLGSMPFALSDFTNAFHRENIRSKDGVDAHIHRVLTTLFGRSH